MRKLVRKPYRQTNISSRIAPVPAWLSLRHFCNGKQGCLIHFLQQRRRCKLLQAWQKQGNLRGGQDCFATRLRLDLPVFWVACSHSCPHLHQAIPWHNSTSSTMGNPWALNYLSRSRTLWTRLNPKMLSVCVRQSLLRVGSNQTKKFWSKLYSHAQLNLWITIHRAEVQKDLQLSCNALS